MQTLSDNIAIIVIYVMIGFAITVTGFFYMLIKNQLKLHRQREQLHRAEITYRDQLLRSVIESQEAERIRIGRDLHDDVCTSLSSLRLQMDTWLRTLPADLNLHAGVVSGKRIIDKVIADARAISHNLSPEIMTVNTPSEAIEELCLSFLPLKELCIRLSNEAPAILDGFSLMSSLAVYRIVEELIHNTVKHAKATHIDVSFKQKDNHLLIDYRDDGTGITSRSQKGRGMQNIESRLGMIQGRYTWLHPKEKGYHISIEIPILLIVQQTA